MVDMQHAHLRVCVCVCVKRVGIAQYMHVKSILPLLTCVCAQRQDKLRENKVFSHPETLHADAQEMKQTFEEGQDLVEETREDAKTLKRAAFGGKDGPEEEPEVEEEAGEQEEEGGKEVPEEDVDHFESDLFEVKQNLEPQPGAGAENHPRVLYRRLETPVHEQIMSRVRNHVQVEAGRATSIEGSYVFSTAPRQASGSQGIEEEMMTYQAGFA
jgi:hypothetical protein